MPDGRAVATRRVYKRQLGSEAASFRRLRHEQMLVDQKLGSAGDDDDEYFEDYDLHEDSEADNKSEIDTAESDAAAAAAPPEPLSTPPPPDPHESFPETHEQPRRARRRRPVLASAAAPTPSSSSSSSPRGGGGNAATQQQQHHHQQHQQQRPSSPSSPRFFTPKTEPASPYGRGSKTTPGSVPAVPPPSRRHASVLVGGSPLGSPHTPRGVASRSSPDSPAFFSPAGSSIGDRSPRTPRGRGRRAAATTPESNKGRSRSDTPPPVPPPQRPLLLLQKMCKFTVYYGGPLYSNGPCRDDRTL